MGIINRDDIRCIITVRGEYVCSECFTDEELREVQRDHIILFDDDEEDIIFCDRCKKRV
jgi:hypothetical protein